ncbi:MAG: transcription antitermination factor NusB [Clostridia bacterium]|nr:transcription antitermination factor NusB [Clostridia bacterium]
MKRRLARETALKVIYQWDVGKNDLEIALKDRIAEVDLDPNNINFIETLVQGTLKNIEEIDQVIEQYLMEWSLDRVSSIDRNILRLGVFEILFKEDTPDKVAVNEAIELAKVFSTDQSAKFINGVLDKVLKFKNDAK